VGRGRDVGVDVECVRPLPDLDGVAARFFSPGEQARLGALPPDERLGTFFALWTLKEAYLKARGDGLSRPPESVEITLDAGLDRASVRELDAADDGRRWELFALRHVTGYAAAVAVERG
jgi:4'-phosphopantetheinyl transferase